MHSVVTVNGSGPGVTLGQVFSLSGSHILPTHAGRVVVIPLTSQPTAQVISSVRSQAMINKLLLYKGARKISRSSPFETLRLLCYKSTNQNRVTLTLQPKRSSGADT